MPRLPFGRVRAARPAATLLAILVAAGLSAPAVFAEAPEDLEGLRKMSRAVAAVAKKAVPAVVFVKVTQEGAGGMTFDFGEGPFEFQDPFNPFEDDFLEKFFGPRAPGRKAPPRRFERKFRQEGQGSGFLISPDGHILTNHHVVGEADKITVRLHDGRELEAKRVGTDPKSDVAVIKIEGSDFPTIALGDSDALEVGEWVVAVGNPFGLAESVTMGIVSAKGRSSVGIADYEDFIQTDAAVNPGNSGGPLLNLDGKAVGMNTAIVSRSGGNMGIGFAIPMNMIKGIKDQLVKSGKVTRGQLGVLIQNLTPELAQSFGVKTGKGVLVSQVVKGSPAEKAGIKEGDVIVRCEGKAVSDVGGLRNEVAMTAPGSKVKLVVVRDGKEKEVAVVVGALPEKPEAAAEGRGEGAPDSLGLEVQDLTAELAEHFGYPLGGGALVARVEAGSAAEDADIQAGDLIVSVNRKPVKGAREFREAAAAAGKKGVLLLVRRGEDTRFVVLKAR